MSIGLSELFVIAIVIAIVIRPEDWPQVVRKLGYWYGKAQKLIHDLNTSIQAMAEPMDDEKDEDVRIPRK